VNNDLTRHLRHKPFPGENGQAVETLLKSLKADKPGLRAQRSLAPMCFDVELITPLFGGGVKAGRNDPQLPIRGKSLRGQLRFWWRLLASHGMFSEAVGAGASSAELYAAEAARWGGAIAGKPRASRIRLRILRTPNTPLKSEPFQIKRGVKSNGGDDLKTNRLFNDSATKYVLFGAEATSEAEIRRLILPGLTFRLEVYVQAGPERGSGNDPAVEPSADAVMRELNDTIKWWATFGGIGARWRRGAGAVRVRVQGKTLSLFLAQPEKQFLKHPKIAGLLIGCRPPESDALAAWRKAVGQLRDFRQTPGTGRKGAAGAEGRSHWPEPDLIRDRVPANPQIRRKHQIEHAMRDWAPRAAFGMPLGIRFSYKQHKTAGEPAGGEIRPLDAKGQLMERMASPLILRPVALADDSGFLPCALLLPQARAVLGLPVGVELPPLANGQRPKPLRGIWPAAPSAADIQSIKPIRETGKSDPLAAFMDYFTRSKDA